MRVNTTVYYVSNNNSEITRKAMAGWIVWVNGGKEHPVMFFDLPTKPTKRQLRKLRKQFRKENPPFTAHEEIVISVLGMQ